jgi:polysaccharide export outer membrane protein
MFKKATVPAYLFAISVLIIIFSSCGSQKDVTYFQRTPGEHDTIPLPKMYVIKIQPGDILSIPVNSLNPAASSFFNPYAGGNTSQDAPTAVGTDYDANSAVRLARNGAPGYIVDQNGMISFPLIGKIRVEGMSTSDLRDTLTKKLKSYLKEPTVSVQLLNFKVSITGEVNRPSSYVIPNELISLPDALTMAGDLTIYGRRTNIMVIREVNGEKVFAHVDLTNREIFSSPYYYLHPNDIVYVEPIKAKSAQTSQTNYLLPVIFSGLSLIIVLLTNVKFK